DEDGTWAAGNTVGVSITNVAPVLALDGAARVDEGSPYVLTLGAVIDPGQDTVGRYTVHWGDGQDSGFDAADLPADRRVAHTYTDGPNAYTVTVDLTDEDGTFLAAGSRTVTVGNVPPTLTLAGAGAVEEGAAYTLQLASSDPGRDTIDHWTIHWGDGIIQTVAGNPGSVRHTYTDGPNSYTISATATDEDGTYDAANQVQRQVRN